MLIGIFLDSMTQCFDKQEELSTARSQRNLGEGAAAVIDLTSADDAVIVVGCTRTKSKVPKVSPLSLSPEERGICLLRYLVSFVGKT